VRPEAPSQLWLWLYGSSIHPAWTNSWNEFPNALDLRLRHFWSLAIEEHFYLVWPFLVWWLSRPALRRVCVFLVVGSLALRIVMRAAGFDWGPIYSFTPARFDALAVGAFLAIVTTEGGVTARPLTPLARRVLLVCGLGVVVCSLAGGDSNFTNWPMLTLGISFFAFFYGALLVLVVEAPASSALGRVFGGRVLSFFGKYSYGIYVYSGLLIPKFEKGPLSVEGMSFAHSYILRLLAHAIVCTAISVAIAVTSYQLYEKPFLKLKRLFE
jgi:peptidoglycan/LPS O-acetylase OafA/YrhL